MHAVDCTASQLAGNALNVECETPRPSAACLAQQTTSNITVVVGGGGDYPNAGAQCSTKHVVEINSSAELAAANAAASQRAAFPYWIAAQYSANSGTW